jgi:2-octaprenylphenol hydroxylase
VYAISPANARFLDEFGAWRHLDAARMQAVRADGSAWRFAGGRLDFSAYGVGASELAWILESSLMQRELWETVKRQGNLSLLCPARPRDLMLAPDAAVLTLDDGRQLTARLVVGADGAESWTRRGRHRGALRSLRPTGRGRQFRNRIAASRHGLPVVPLRRGRAGLAAAAGRTACPWSGRRPNTSVEIC